MTTLIIWSKTFYTTIGQYPTLYDYLTNTQKDLIRWEYHPDNPYTSRIPKVFRYTLKEPLECTVGRCRIICVIQLKHMNHPSVIPPI